MTQGKSSSVKTTSHCIVILHDIRSVINVGAIFRTCDAVGVSEIILSGTSPAPIDRFGRIRSDFAKSALGAEKTVSWKQVLDVAAIIDELKKDGYEIYSIEQSPDSVDYKNITVKPNSKIVIIPGNEVDGVPIDIQNMSDAILEIPMHGSKESLNVSVATGIILYRLLDQ
jgi:tRNA G18 (ribose-2'-O)-methylase SpoU